MKISIITPTNGSKHLTELHHSIENQTHTDWEWIILLNNEAKHPGYESDKIKIIKAPFKSKSIGLLKKYAFMQGTGDILLEADHDDILTPNCLHEVAQAFEEDPEIGFVYSDNAKLPNEGKTFTPYNEAYGWTHEKTKINDKELISMHSFKPSAASLAFIWFAPDHVRAWRTEVYHALGGHDEELDVCDDHDLLCRTFLATKMKHVDKVLYLYRITGDNTWLQRNQRIQEKTKEIMNKYIYALAERNADILGLKKIDLCGGFNKPQGYESVDKENGDIIADLEKGIPLPDNSVGVVRAHDALEHIQNKDLIMKEIHRVLAPGGFLLSMTPSTDGRGAFQDPTHIAFYNENSFWYYTRPNLMKYIRNESVQFSEFRLDTMFPSEWHRVNNICYVYAYLMKLGEGLPRIPAVN